MDKKEMKTMHETVRSRLLLPGTVYILMTFVVRCTR
jgi:hypothetical protein